MRIKRLNGLALIIASSFMLQCEGASDNQQIISVVSVSADKTIPDRPPMLFWQGNGLEWNDDELALLNAKGVLPALPIIEPNLTKAKQFARLGLPLYLLEGRGSGHYPYSLAKDYVRINDNWQREYPSPFDIRGWFNMSQQVRDAIHTYRSTDAELAAVIFDFELFPRGFPFDWFSQSPELKKQLPNPDRSYSEEEYANYQHDYESALHSAYLAAPVRETAPDALVTNWGVYCNSSHDPIVNSDKVILRNRSTGLFNASNTFAYGWGRALRYWRQRASPSLTDDDIYFWSILKQTSEDARNQQRHCPMLRTTTWVSRYVNDSEDIDMPIMDRQRYRDALAHLWFRGVDMMLIFNPRRDRVPSVWLEELEDALKVYAKVEPYWQDLQRGRLLNLQTPSINAVQGMWSGVEYEGRTTIITTCFTVSCQFSIPLNGGERLIQSASGTKIVTFAKLAR